MSHAQPTQKCNILFQYVNWLRKIQAYKENEAARLFHERIYHYYYLLGTITGFPILLFIFIFILLLRVFLMK